MTVTTSNPQATFIHIPKNAGTSITHWLISYTNTSQPMEKVHGGKHADQYRVEKFLRQRNQTLGFTFCVVRNPWDRLVSTYHYYIKRGQINPKKLSFDDFIKGKWKEGNKWGCSRKQQHQYYYDMDIILRYENLEEDFKQIQDFYGIKKDLGTKNTSKHKDYKSYYNQERIDIVAEHCKKDIKIFNYDF